ncbi:MAG TPA: HAD family hydrolase [candidate division Zixibacteria bacterium]|nr:HAD family hydrolase [candidate division Zixibacteria bacterium]
MKIEAVVFDLDDTLIEDERVALATIQEACGLATEKYGIDAETLRHTVRWTAREIWYDGPAADYVRCIGSSSWEGLWMEIRTQQPETRALADWLPEYRRRAWNEALSKHEIVDEALAETMSARYMAVKRKNPFLFEDTIPTLERLRDNYRLAILTNGLIDLQQDKVDIAGLRDYFEIIMVSGEIGIGKPDRRIFESVHEKLGLRIDQTVMVGNSLKSDIAGARSIGMKSIWLNRKGESPDFDLLPELEIPNLTQLFTILTAPRRPW